MAAPIELMKGGERMTVYNEAKGDALVADGWQRVRDLTPQKQAELADRPPAPWKGYDDMRVEEVLAQSAGLPPERIKEIVTYESATKGRVSIIGKLTGNVPTPVARAAQFLGVAQEQLEAVVPRRAQRSAPEDGMPVTIETVVENEMQTTETVEIVDAEDAPL